MPFPITVNGNVYDVSDFAVTNYAKNLGKFLFDAQTHRNNRLYATSVTSVSLSSASFAMVVGTGKDFVPGMSLIMAYAGTDELLAIAKVRVTSYSAGTLNLSKDQHLVLPPGVAATARANWIIAPSLVPEFGASTVGGASSLGLPVRTTTTQEVFEDFTGYHAPATEGSYSIGVTPTTPSWADNETRVASYEVDVVVFGKKASGVQKGLYYPDAYTAAGEHPGLLQMNVQNAQDTVGVCLPGAVIPLDGTLAFELEVCFMMPVVEVDDKTGRTNNLFGLSVGFSKGGTNGGSVYEMLPDDYQPLNLPLTGPAIRAGHVGLELELTASNTAASSAPAVKMADLEAGKWYVIKFTRGASAVIIATVEVDETITTYSFTGQTGRGFPFFNFRKLSGNQPLICFLDYFAFKATLSRN